MWQSEKNGSVKWWKVDLESFYTISEVEILFFSNKIYSNKIELLKDNHTWKTVTVRSNFKTNDKYRVHNFNNNVVFSFVRIAFDDSRNKSVSIKEVQVLEKPITGK